MGWEMLPGGSRLHDGNYTKEEEMESYKRCANLKGFTANPHQRRRRWVNDHGRQPVA